MEEVVWILEKFSNQGHKLSTGYSPESGGFFAMIKQGGVPYPDGVAVSCWASSLKNALTGLAFFLEVIAPDFPEGVPPRLGPERFW